MLCYMQKIFLPCFLNNMYLVNTNVFFEFIAFIEFVGFVRVLYADLHSAAKAATKLMTTRYLYINLLINFVMRTNVYQQDLIFI